MVLLFVDELLATLSNLQENRKSPEANPGALLSL
jgi:hypothetical protein